MDNIRFGAFIAQLRKEQSITQKELADKLNVTDKAVSKWETGKGFPDIKLLEPLAQTLGVTLVELIQGTRIQRDNLTINEAESVITQAIEQSQRVTARRYLRLLRWLLTVIGAAAVYQPLVLLGAWIYYGICSSNFSIIGGTDGPASIFVFSATAGIPFWLWPLLLLLVSILCFALIIRIRKLENNLK